MSEPAPGGAVGDFFAGCVAIACPVRWGVWRGVGFLRAPCLDIFVRRQKKITLRYFG